METVSPSWGSQGKGPRLRTEIPPPGRDREENSAAWSSAAGPEPPGAGASDRVPPSEGAEATKAWPLLPPAEDFFGIFILEGDETGRACFVSVAGPTPGAFWTSETGDTWAWEGSSGGRARFFRGIEYEEFFDDSAAVGGGASASLAVAPFIPVCVCGAGCEGNRCSGPYFRSKSRLAGAQDR